MGQADNCEVRERVLSSIHECCALKGLWLRKIQRLSGVRTSDDVSCALPALDCCADPERTGG